jgi:hypothetical protein
MSMLLGYNFDPYSNKLEELLLKLKKQKIPSSIYEIIVSCIEGQVSSCEAFYKEVSYLSTRQYNHNKKLNKALNIAIIALVMALALLGTVFACR